MEQESRALETPAARAALNAVRKQGWNTVLSGAVAAFVGLVTAAADVTWMPLALALAWVGTGGMLLHRAARVETLLEHHPWRARRVVRVEGGRLGPTVVLDVEERGELWPLVVALPVGQQVDVRGHQVLWTAGDPRFGVVLSPPGGNQFRLAFPARGRRLRRVASAPEVRALPGRSLADVRPVVRRRKVFRWVLLLGAGCFLFAAVGSGAGRENSGDVEVGLTVLDRSRDGSCVVRFDDPFTGEEREEPYHCDEGGDAALRNYETGRVAARWPGRAVLYNEKYQDAPPSTAPDVFDTVGYASLVLVPLSFVGAAAGRTFHLRRWRRAVEASGSGHAALRGGAGPLDHAGAVARAERLAPKGGPAVPDGDLRTAPWWRVRGLRLIVGEGELFGRLFAQLGALTLGLCLTVLFPAPPEASPVLLGLLALSAAWSGWSVYRRLPAVRALRDAASAPGPRRRRYVLLPATPRPRVEAQRLLLVVFPEDGGDDALPEGLLEVQAPGTKRRPWAGLPASAGTVELHGPRGGDGKDAPVVPVIGDLVLWPVGRYEETGQDGLDRRGLLAVTAEP